MDEYIPEFNLYIDDNFYMEGYPISAQAGQDILITWSLSEDIDYNGMRIFYQNKEEKKEDYPQDDGRHLIPSSFVRGGILGVQFLFDMPDGSTQRTNVIWINLRYSIIVEDPQTAMDELQARAITAVSQDVNNNQFVFYNLAWGEVARVSYVGHKINQQFISGGNLNNYYGTNYLGFYYAQTSSNIANKPPNVTDFGLEVTRVGGSNYRQKVTTLNRGKFERFNTGFNQWTAWVEIT